MAKTLNKQTILKMNSENGASIKMGGYAGNPEELLKNKDAEFKNQLIVEMDKPGWDGTAKQVANTEILRAALTKYNATQLPEDRTALYEPIYIDLARRILEQPDLTAFVDDIITNENFGDIVGFKDFIDIDAIFDTIAGTGDAADLIELETGDKTTVFLELNGVGWRDTLLNTLFNRDIGYITKVLKAVAKGYAAKMNDLAMNRIVTITFDASMKVAADATGSTIEEKRYLTLDAAVELMGTLKDPLTGDDIDISNLALVVRPSEQRGINRSINGVINQNSEQVNRTALTEITTIVPYKAVSLRMGKKKVTYPGVAAKTAYMMVPKARRYSLRKKGLTSLESEGAATTFTQKERAWFFVCGRYDDLHFGSSDATTKAALAAKFNDDGEGYGYIIKIALP